MIIVAICLLSSLQVNASSLQKACLACHIKEQIPNEIIYKRYLLKYSTKERMQKAIFSYLKKPNKIHSIMPKIFFTKFPMKPKNRLSDEDLNLYINLYLEEFDIKKRLVLEK